MGAATPSACAPDLNARTGEFTPPGSRVFASSNICRGTGWPRHKRRDLPSHSSAAGIRACISGLRQGTRLLRAPGVEGALHGGGDGLDGCLSTRTPPGGLVLHRGAQVGLECQRLHDECRRRRTVSLSIVSKNKKPNGASRVAQARVRSRMWGPACLRPRRLITAPLRAAAPCPLVTVPARVALTQLYFDKTESTKR